MNQVYVIEALRTPFGSFGGTLAEVPATELAATVARALIDRTGIDPATLDETTFELRDPSNALVPATVSYDANNNRANLQLGPGA